MISSAVYAIIGISLVAFFILTLAILITFLWLWSSITKITMIASQNLEDYAELETEKKTNTNDNTN